MKRRSAKNIMLIDEIDALRSVNALIRDKRYGDAMIFIGNRINALEPWQILLDAIDAHPPFRGMHQGFGLDSLGGLK